MFASRNLQVSRTVTFLIAVSLICTSSQAQYSGGTGEPNDPYRIASVNNLLELSAEPNDWDKYFILISDINLDGHVFSDALIGTAKIVDQDWFEGMLFTGTFDGDGFTISNLFIDANDSKRDCVGLFGVVGTEGVIKNLSLDNVYIIASDYVSGLAGINKGTINNCTSNGFVSGDEAIGGLVGDNRGNIFHCYSTGEIYVSSNDIDSNEIGGHAGINSYGATISYCRSTCEITGLDRKCKNFGGLIGWNQGIVLCCYSGGLVNGDHNSNTNFGGLIGNNEGSVMNCRSEGTVVGKNNVGGLTGRNNGRISNCYSTGSVTANQYIGGLIGYNIGDAVNCYSIGEVNGESHRGGLIGYSTSTSISNCFWDVNSSGLEVSAAGEGLTTSEMMEKNNYQAVGWDFLGKREDGLHEIWQMPESGGYPVFSIFNGYEPAQLTGNGMAEYPYLICNENEFASVLYYGPVAHYRLTCDIDLSGIIWPSAIIPEFKGVFDGNSHAVSNVAISGINRIGLFGIVHPEAEVKNLAIENAIVAGTNYIGGLAGVDNGKINTCSITGRITGNQYVGGLTGFNSDRVIQCYSIGEVTGTNYIGGLAGYNNGDVIQCYSISEVAGSRFIGGLTGFNTGDVSQCYCGGVNECYRGDVNQCYCSGQITITGDSFVGGIAGDNLGGSIINCYNLATVNSTSMAGGITGYNYDGVIIKCYSTGKISGNEDVGGMVGDDRWCDHSWIPPKCYHGTTLNSFWDIHTSEIATSDGGTGKTTTQMTNVNTYKNEGWDFTNIWEMPRIGYPKLRWQAYKEPIIYINNLDDLMTLASNSECWERYFMLTADLDLSGITLNPIGDSTRNFNGVFDGNNYTISNLNINLPDTSGAVGMFGILDNTGIVKNLKLENISIRGRNLVGGIVGHNKGNVNNCSITGEVSGSEDTGGLVGHNSGSVHNCSNTCKVTGDRNIGGLAGHNSEGSSIRNCCSNNAESEINGVEYVGGLVGLNRGNLNTSKSSSKVSGNNFIGGLVGRNVREIYNCYSIGDVEGNRGVGGLIGRNDSSINFAVSYCYSTGHVAGNNEVGGLVGSVANSGLILVSFWDVQTSGRNNMCGSQNKQGNGCYDFYGKTTAEMQTEGTFLWGGWDFDGETTNGSQDIWRINEGLDYPHLWWE
jgi:hypothetical protein